MLLGPPPKCPNALTKALDHDDRNDRDTSADQQAKDLEEYNPNASLERRPRRRLCITKEGDHSCTCVKTDLSDSERCIPEVLPLTGILDGLESQKGVGKNQSSTLKMGNDGPNLKQEHDECSCRVLVSPKKHDYFICHKDKPRHPNSGPTSPPRCCSPQLRSRPESKRHLSPLKSRLHSFSPSPNHPGVRNQEWGEVGTEERLRSPQARSYNADEVREYMNRQLVERKKKEREEKRSVKHAIEMRKKRLQEVYRKQKEALSKKTRGKQRSSSLGAGKKSTKQVTRVGASQVIKAQASAQANMEPGDFKERGIYQRELNDTKRPFQHYLSSKYGPLRLQDLESCRYSQERSSPPAQLSQSIDELLPLAYCEGEMSCKASGIGYKDKQQRIEELCSMATALSGRIENEARRLGVEADVWKRPGSQSWDKGREQADLGGFTRADPMVSWTDAKRQHIPSPKPLPSPQASLCDFLPARHQEWEEQQGSAVLEDEMLLVAERMQHPVE
ncbi:uncharacterized protein LOC125465273 [Stegostoma tigrinum]|uniref:uncharacterized protein LOC125465273 n=1 Tax=Stegostoma tigrinum TaxID=3053191 RepID=UPI002870B0AB|nr:uncharacterized protein LOC125465273 [Stegostoma tigrinum]